jgi:hypothetical protein
MANFPGPTYNRIIETDPQIVKVPMDNVGWGARMSIFGMMSADPASSSSQKSGQPKAPEMSIKHVD